MKVSNCGSDEQGRYKGGEAGDQTAREWRIRDWYDFGQTMVLRHPQAKVRKLIAAMARAAAENNMVGYDQSQRETFWQQLQKADYKPEGIKTKCEADCSSGVAAIVKGAGHRLNDSKLKAISPSIYTGNAKTALVKAGFEVITEAAYLRGPAKLVRGDILLREYAHMNVVVGDTIAVDGVLGTETIKALQRTLGVTVDGKIGAETVKALQRWLNEED